MGGTGMEERGASFAGSTPPFLGRKRAAVDVDVGPERRGPHHHETFEQFIGKTDTSHGVCAFAWYHPI